MGLEILFSDVLDGRKGFPGYRNVLFLQSRHISDFLKGLAHVILHESFKFVCVAI